ncbi:Prolyl oligopeptidase family protein [Polystyrenella longa]|uniref:Prolyl oligopeptidase family protein n=2 Tax=Polystyrenella longa TaxID=2528007 RepID=A0A518CLJ7_9PLAN|nr:Prolyl oligopeptidase family protein [Polystyrenella longa]
MGGGSALVFTGRHPVKVKAVCDVFGITDYAKFHYQGSYNDSLKAAFGGSPLQQPKYYSERSAINYINVLKNKPVLILHGDQDAVVPQSNSDDMVNKLTVAGGKVKYFVVPGMAHDNAIIKNLEHKVLNYLMGTESQ